MAALGYIRSEGYVVRMPGVRELRVEVFVPGE